jgi:predicted DsbA family dithiol-disulfide isomerase
MPSAEEYPMDELRQTVRVDVFSDVACPWCFIGLRNLQAARDAWEGPSPEIHWRAFQLQPDHPPRGIPFRELVETKFGGPERYAQMTAHLISVGAEAGIPFAMDRITVSPNTRLAHGVIAAARGSGDEEAVVDALFTGYFSEGVDITDPDAVVALLEAHGAIVGAGAIVAAAAAGRYDAQVDADLAIGAEIGVQAVPVFVADGVRGIVGAQPPEAITQLMLGELAAD